MFPRKITLMIVLAVFALGAWAQSSPPSGTAIQSPQDKLKRPSKHSGLPVVGEFQRSEESARDQVHRQMREERYGKILPEPITDPGKLVDGQPETLNATFIDYVVTGQAKDPHGVPASTSNAVVVATVLGGKCFINAEHTFVYTDYQLRIDQILKQDAGAVLSVGSQVVGARPGGAIHFPSGHVTTFLNMGHGLPAIGSQYILFLWRSIPNFPEYEIVFASGYELRDNHVFPLDDMNAEYENMNAPDFLNIVQKAIAASKDGGHA